MQMLCLSCVIGVRLSMSVRVTVTLLYCVKTTQARNVKFSPWASRKTQYSGANHAALYAFQIVFW